MDNNQAVQERATTGETSDTMEPQKQVQFNEHDNPIDKKSNQLITSEDGKTESTTDLTPTPPVEEEREIEKSPSQRFIKYDKEVGRGSFKTVYKALDTVHAQPVAWLELQPHKLTKEDRNRFKSEAEILKKLKHPNIVQFYDSWEANLQGRSVKTTVCVTELMTSGTLKGYLRKFKVIRSKPLKSWSRQILLGLQYLHSRDPPILHRDLKCDNIFVTGQTGVVKIGDLGLATIKRHGGNAKSVIGTPEFMAPEMYEENYAEPVDVYAFGMCLMEMVTNEYPYEECKNATAIFRKVVAGELPNAFKKVEDDKIKAIIKSCIEPKPEERITVHQLLENDFFEEKYLKVLDVGKNGNELKLRLVVNEPGVNNRRMPEDEAIDFTFHIGVDTALQVSQDMAKESTLNNADVALVARSIQTAVDKYKLHPVSESAEKSIENGDTKIKVENVKNVKVKANTEIKIVSDVKKDEKKDETKEQVKQPENDNVVVNEGEKEKVEPPPPEQQPASDQPVSIKKDPESVTASSSKSNVETKKREKKKGNHKKGISFTVVQIKKKENGNGWDVHVRITALEITTISFSVEQLKSIDDTVKQLSNEVVKNNLITEAQREKAEELLKKLIKRLFDGHMIQGSDIQPTRYPTQVSWKGCRRLEDGNMEIEVDVDSVRHVPSYLIKFTKNKIEHQVKSIKELGIIQDCEIISVTNQFKEHWQTSVEKMGTKKEPEEQPKIEQTDISPDEIDAKLKTETKDSQTNLTIIKVDDEQKETIPVVAPVTAPPTNRFTIQTVAAKEETIAPIDKPNDKPVINVPQTQQPVPQVTAQPGRFTINTVTTKKPPVQPQQAVQSQVQQQVSNQPVVSNEPNDKSKVDGGTQTGDEGGNSSLDKPTGEAIQRSIKQKSDVEQPPIEHRLTNELIKQGIEVKQTVSQLPKKVELDQKNKAKRQETQKSDSTDVNESSMSDDDTRRERDDLRSVNRLISDQSKVIQEFTNQMADIRAEIDKETELLSNTLESINKRNKKFFDTWDAMMKKLTTKRKIPGGNRNRRSRTKTVNDQKEQESSGSGNDEKKPVQNFNATMPAHSGMMPPPMPPNPNRYDQPYQAEFYHPRYTHNPSPPGGQQSDNGSTYNPPNISLVQPMNPMIQSAANRGWNVNPGLPINNQQPTAVTTQTIQPSASATNPTQNGPPNGAQSVISEPPARTRQNQNYVPPFGYYTGPMNPPQQQQINLGSLTGLGSSLLPPAVQQQMEQGYGNDVAIHMACQLLQNLNRQQQQQQQPNINQQLNINSLMGNMQSEISPYQYNQSIPQQQTNQQQNPGSISQQSLQQVQRQTQPNQQANDQVQAAEQATRQQQQQQQAPPPGQPTHQTTQQQGQQQQQQMKQPQQTHSQINMIQQTRPQQVDPIPTDGLSQLERNQRTSEWVQNIDPTQIATNNAGDDARQRQQMNQFINAPIQNGSMTGSINANLGQAQANPAISQFQAHNPMQTLQAVQVKQMQQPQANQPTQAPTQGNPVLMQNTQQQNVQQMMPPQGNINTLHLQNAYHQANEQEQKF